MPTNSLSFAFRQRCEAIATEQRYLLNKLAFDPLPAIDLVNMLGIRVQSTEQTGVDGAVLIELMDAQNWSAMLFGANPPMIIYRPDHSLARRESDLMHELAHVLLKHPYGRYNAITSTISKNSQHEQEADYLGSCLQIPRRAMQWAAQLGLTIDQTASHFGASTQMVEWRIRMTGISL
ncbi:ImmA/IrrE family metallo-endopeptidase [Spirosoma jeollabukense]